MDNRDPILRVAAHIQIWLTTIPLQCVSKNVEICYPQQPLFVRDKKEGKSNTEWKKKTDNRT